MFFLKRDKNRGSLNLELALLIGVLVVGSAIGLTFLGKEISNSFLAAGGSVKQASFLNLTSEDSGSGTDLSVPKVLCATGFGSGGHYTSDSAPAPIEADWTYVDNGDGTYTASKYNGTSAIVSAPFEYNGKPVTKLYSGTKLVPVIPKTVTTFYVPDSVKTIGAYACDSCTALTSVYMPYGLTTIGRSAFYSCSMTSIDIPDTVTSIEAFAFSTCKSLTSVIIPEGITIINTYSFDHCTALTSVKIPSTVTSIDTWAFAYCSALTTVELPSGLTNIGGSAFYYATGLTTMTIPYSVQTFGAYIFLKCAKLTVKVPSAKITYWYSCGAAAVIPY